MPEWADVCVTNDDDRLTLEGKALFFIPAARLLLEPKNISSNTLNARSLALKSRNNNEILAGRKALSNVMGCKPVVYESAVGFINVANAELEERKQPERFTNRSIVACVFHLRGLAETAKALNQSAEDIAQGSSVPLRIVISAIANSRVSYIHAEEIRRHLIACGGAGRPELEEAAFISTRVLTWGSASVGKIGRTKKDDEVDEWVYERPDLKPAPLSGHPWALESIELAEPTVAVGGSS